MKMEIKFGTKENKIDTSAYNKFFSLLMSVVISLGLLQACSGESQESQAQRFPESSIADEFISESELNKLLGYADGKTRIIGSYYRTYTLSWSNDLSRDLGMKNIQSQMTDFPDLYKSAVKVFEEWRESGEEHDDGSTNNGLWNINVAIVKDYLDTKYNGIELGAEFDISNQDESPLLT